MLVNALLVGLAGVIARITSDLGALMFTSPIVMAPVVGLLLGDLHSGIVMGATLQLIFMGVVAIGGTMPADSCMGSILGTAFAILSGKGPEVALALAVPVGMLAQPIAYGWRFIRATFMNRADEYAREGNESGIVKIHFGLWVLWWFIYASVIFFAVYFGTNTMESALNAIPTVITEGLKVASGMLPAVGFALLLSMLWSKELAAYFFLGFILSTFLKLPMIAIAGLGVIIAVASHFESGAKMNLAPASKGSAVDFKEEEGFFDA